MTQSGPAVKAALIDLFRTLYPDAYASYGMPGAYQPDEIAAVLNQRFEMTRPTYGTGRSREESVETDVVFSVLVPGGEEAQQAATERAYAMALALDEHFRTKPQETLGNSCRDAWITEGELSEDKSVPDPRTGEGVVGRIANVTVILSSVHRRS